MLDNQCSPQIAIRTGAYSWHCSERGAQTVGSSKDKNHKKLAAKRAMLPIGPPRQLLHYRFDGPPIVDDNIQIAARLDRLF